MKVITCYKTKDGKIFQKENDAEKHEKIYNLVEKATNLILPDKFDNLEFANGKGFIQITDETYDKFMAMYKQSIEIECPEYLAIFEKDPKGFIGRCLSDGGYISYKLYCLRSQINQRRLYGQIYFANNPEKAFNKEIGIV